MLNKLCHICNINYAIIRLVARQMINPKGFIVYYLYDKNLNSENKSLTYGL